MKIIMNILSKEKKLRVIFRGINIDYYNSKNISVLKQEKLKQEWDLIFKQIYNSFTRKTNLLERTRKIYRVIKYI